MNPLKVIISGGGSGGHIFPAVAIANTIKAREPGADILFVGANGRMEMEKVPQAGYPIKGLNIAGFQRGSIFKNIFLPFKIVDSLFSAYRIVKDFKPDVAVGVGGYASGPLLRAAGFAGVPTVIQEQNSFAGITNKLLAKGASVICTGYGGMEKVFPKEKIVVTGNPVRSTIASIKATRSEAASYFNLDVNRKTIFITGGSLGARTLNQAVIASKEKIRNSGIGQGNAPFRGTGGEAEPGTSPFRGMVGGIQVLWQTGKIYFEDCKKEAEGIPNLKAMQFVDRMDYAYTIADIVISRAGALSISELQLVGKPVILVPSPNVTEDHQTYNAMELVKRNAAVMIRDEEAKATLIDTALSLLSDEARLAILSKNIRQMAIPDAAERIVEEIFKVANK